jgi:hypothetical protein
MMLSFLPREGFFLCYVIYSLVRTNSKLASVHINIIAVRVAHELFGRHHAENSKLGSQGAYVTIASSIDHCSKMFQIAGHQTHAGYSADSDREAREQVLDQ